MLNNSKGVKKQLKANKANKVQITTGTIKVLTLI